MPLHEVLLRHALAIVMDATLPVVLSALAGGLVVGIFQSLTQLNDSTFSLAPKLVVAVLVILVLGRWMLRLDAHLARTLIGHMGAIVGLPWS